MAGWRMILLTAQVVDLPNCLFVIFIVATNAQKLRYFSIIVLINIKFVI